MVCVWFSSCRISASQGPAQTRPTASGYIHNAHGGKKKNTYTLACYTCPYHPVVFGGAQATVVCAEFRLSSPGEERVGAAAVYKKHKGARAKSAEY